jgi:hypothetical protein
MTGRLPASNPFSTRHVRPGAIPYFFPADVGVAALVERLQSAGWRGQIIGPHGTGKSTLLATLLPELERAGKIPVVITLHDGTRRVPGNVWQTIHQQVSPNHLLVIDGYEQLGFASRWRLKWHCFRRSVGLLVTTHTSVGLPEVYRTQVNREQAEQVVRHLLRGRDSTVAVNALEQQLAAHDGNLREALFALYDLHERSCSRNRTPASGRTMPM